MDCERCGEELPPTGYEDGEPVWWDGDSVTCACGTVSHISCDGEEPAYVQWWTCKHGLDDATPCAACDAEDAATADAGKGEDRG